MTSRNTASQFGWPAKLLHWVVALLLIGLVYAGLTFTGMERSPERGELAALHKSFGLTLLLIMTIRLVWKMMNPTPADPPGTPGWQSLAARLTHWALYAAVYFQLIMGILVSGQRPIAYFGLFEIPPLLEPNEQQHEFFEEMHEAGWIILAVLTGLHVLAALYHHFVKKDDVLRRITTG